MLRTLILPILFALSAAPAWAVEPLGNPPPAREEIESELSTRDISIQSSFTGIEILIYGSIDFSQTQAPNESYDVIMVVRAPDQPIVARRKERVAGMWINDPGKVYAALYDGHSTFACGGAKSRARFKNGYRTPPYQVICRMAGVVLTPNLGHYERRFGSREALGLQARITSHRHFARGAWRW